MKSFGKKTPITRGLPSRLAPSVVAGFLLCLPANMAQADQVSITHRYSFNDGSANDSAGGIHGTFENGASARGGKLVLANNGIDTDPATGQYVSLSGNILNTRNFTLETWFTFNGGNPWQRLLDLGNSVSDPTRGTIGQGFLILTMNGANNPLGQISINSWGSSTDTDFVAGDTAFPVGGEHSLAYVHNTDAQTETLYLDGILIGSSPADVDPSTADYSNFFIGRSQFTQDPFYNGSVDELRTYDGAFTEAQILASHAAGPDIVAIPEPGSVSLVALGTCLLLRFKRKRQDEADGYCRRKSKSSDF